jgi:rod shape determining protein RodA
MNELKHIDKILLGCLLALAAVGMATLYAATWQGNPNLFYRQGVFWLFGFALMLSLCFIPTRMIALTAWPGYLLALIALALVPLVGEVQMGARRWLNLGIVNLQPSEMMKWALMLMLAFWFASREANRLSALAAAVAFAALPAALIIIQPDLGTTLVLLFAASAMIMAAGLPWKWFFAAVVAALASLPLLWSNMHDYQKSRVLSFLDPQSDPLGAGYHVIQSSIAIGSGGLFGQGFLQGSQARLHFLPEQHTDFIFAVLAEEGGLFASAILLALYGIMLLRILFIAHSAHSRFASLLCIGIATIFMLYVFVNIGMVSGMLPVVGVPLPFISYGGSALVTMLVALGLVLRVSIESNGTIPWQRTGNPLA